MMTTTDRETVASGTPVYREGGYGGTSGPGVILGVTGGRALRTHGVLIPEVEVFSVESRLVRRCWVYPWRHHERPVGVGWYLARPTNRASAELVARYREEGTTTARIQQERDEAARDEAARELETGRALYGETVPTWARAAILATHETDESDSMTDYFAVRGGRTVVLTWSKHTRNLFPELRKAAASFAPTADLATAGPDAEHRENYSMGAGTYLKAGGRYTTGWMVRKLALSYADHRDTIARCLARGEVVR